MVREYQVGNNLYPEKDYIGLGDGPLDPGDLDQGYGTAFGAAIGQGIASSPVIGTGITINAVPPLAREKWVPPIGQDTVRPLYTVENPDDVTTRGDKLFQTEDELKGYIGYNSKIPFEPGMTQARYDALVEARTNQLRREAATTGHPFINILGQVIGGAPDPSSYIPVFGQLGNAWKLGKGARLGWNIVKSGSEGAVGSTLATAAISDRERAMGNDMSLKAYLETASMGFMIGAVFGTLGHGIVRALNSRTPNQAAASQTIVSSPITPETAPESIAVLADAYDSFMTNNGLATPYFTGGKGGPIQFGSHSQEAFTKGIQIAQKSIDLNWLNVIYRRKSEMEPMPSLGTRVEKYEYLNDIQKRIDDLQKENPDAKTGFKPAGQETVYRDYNQLKQELDDYYTVEIDYNVVSRIIDDPAIKQRMIGSQIKDATGKPITLFIGTPYGTNTRLDMSKAGMNVGGKSAKMTLWATDNPNDASGYSLSQYFEKEDFNANNAGDGEEFLIIDEAPNVRPILLDMKNPMIIDYAGKGYDEFRHVDTINEARIKGHDGVVFKNIIDTPHLLYDVKDVDMKVLFNKAQTPSTHYAIFDPKQIIDLQDVSADFGKVIDAQQAYIDAHAAKANSLVETSNMKSPAITGYDFGIQKGYDYDSQVAASTVINDVAVNKFIDVLPLIKAAEKNDEVKYQELSNEAADLDLEAKTTGFEDEMELALARVPITPQEEAFALKVDEDIAVADKLEVFIHAAIKCMGD